MIVAKLDKVACYPNGCQTDNERVHATTDICLPKTTFAQSQTEQMANGIEAQLASTVRTPLRDNKGCTLYGGYVRQIDQITNHF